MVAFDKGPPAALARHFADLPEIAPSSGSCSGTTGARSSTAAGSPGRRASSASPRTPGPTERVVGRTLVGDAGQRVQGFLGKLGLTRSYVLVNAFPVAVHPGKVSKALPLLADEDQLRWRNRFYDLVTGPSWRRSSPSAATPRGAGPVGQQAGRADVQGAAPVQPDDDCCCEQWRTAIPDLRAVVTPDRDGVADRPQLRRRRSRSPTTQPIPAGGPALRAARVDG